MNNNFFKVEISNLSDPDLFKIMILLKRSTSGIITQEEFDFLEQIRININTNIDHVNYFEILKKMYQIYNDEFFKRKSN